MQRMFQFCDILCIFLDKCNFLTGESDKICLPTAPTQRQVPMDVDSSETDSVQSDLIINSKKSISDHISELKNARVSKKLNYSKAVQCVPLPPRFKGASHLEITEILPSCDGSHILVVLKSKIATLSSVLIVYSLDFEAPVVRLKEFPVCVRVLEVNTSICNTKLYIKIYTMHKKNNFICIYAVLHFM